MSLVHINHTRVWSPISKRSTSLGTPPCLRTNLLALRNLAKFAIVSVHKS